MKPIFSPHVKTFAPLFRFVSEVSRRRCCVVSITVYHLSSLADQVLVRTNHALRRWNEGGCRFSCDRDVYTERLLNTHLRLIGICQPSSSSQPKTSKA